MRKLDRYENNGNWILKRVNFNISLDNDEFKSGNASISILCVSVPPINYCYNLYKCDLTVMEFWFCQVSKSHWGFNV